MLNKFEIAYVFRESMEAISGIEDDLKDVRQLSVWDALSERIMWIELGGV